MATIFFESQSIISFHPIISLYVRLIYPFKALQMKIFC